MGSEMDTSETQNLIRPEGRGVEYYLLRQIKKLLGIRE